MRAHQQRAPRAPLGARAAGAAPAGSAASRHRGGPAARNSPASSGSDEQQAAMRHSAAIPWRWWRRLRRTATATGCGAAARRCRAGWMRWRAGRAAAGRGRPARRPWCRARAQRQFQRLDHRRQPRDGGAQVVRRLADAGGRAGDLRAWPAAPRPIAPAAPMRAAASRSSRTVAARSAPSMALAQRDHGRGGLAQRGAEVALRRRPGRADPRPIRSRRRTALRRSTSASCVITRSAALVTWVMVDGMDGMTGIARRPGHLDRREARRIARNPLRDRPAPVTPVEATRTRSPARTALRRPMVLP